MVLVPLKLEKKNTEQHIQNPLKSSLGKLCYQQKKLSLERVKKCEMRDNLYFRANIYLYSENCMRKSFTSHESRKVYKVDFLKPGSADSQSVFQYKFLITVSHSASCTSR